MGVISPALSFSRRRFSISRKLNDPPKSSTCLPLEFPLFLPSLQTCLPTALSHSAPLLKAPQTPGAASLVGEATHLLHVRRKVSEKRAATNRAVVLLGCPGALFSCPLFSPCSTLLPLLPPGKRGRTVHSSRSSSPIYEVYDPSGLSEEEAAKSDVASPTGPRIRMRSERPVSGSITGARKSAARALRELDGEGERGEAAALPPKKSKANKTVAQRHRRRQNQSGEAGASSDDDAAFQGLEEADHRHVPSATDGAAPETDGTDINVIADSDDDAAGSDPGSAAALEHLGDAEAAAAEHPREPRASASDDSDDSDDSHDSDDSDDSGGFQYGPYEPTTRAFIDLFNDQFVIRYERFGLHSRAKFRRGPARTTTELYKLLGRELKKW